MAAAFQGLGIQDDDPGAFPLDSANTLEALSCPLDNLADRVGHGGDPLLGQASAGAARSLDQRLMPLAATQENRGRPPTTPRNERPSNILVRARRREASNRLTTMATSGCFPTMARMLALGIMPIIQVSKASTLPGLDPPSKTGTSLKVRPGPSPTWPIRACVTC